MRPERGNDRGGRTGAGTDIIPFRRLLAMACAYLRWSPAEFWAATPHELYPTLMMLDPKRRAEQQQADQFAEFEKRVDKHADK